MFLAMPATKTLYETDYNLWVEQQASALVAGDLSRLDIDNLVEEVEDLSGRNKDELESRLCVLLMHLLKWQHQPSERSGSWSSTIREQRRQIKKRLNKSPSLKPYLIRIFQEGDEYDTARRNAADETGLPLIKFPERCPYSIEDVLQDEWKP